MENKFMNLAVTEAIKGFNRNEIPVGAVIVKDNKVIAKAYNKKNKKNDSLAHAELIVIKKASKKLKNWRLNGCEMYITLEPCPMCASAIKQSRITKIYYGASNSDKNNHQIVKEIFKNTDINKAVEYQKGIMEQECIKLLEKFFKNKRKAN